MTNPNRKSNVKAAQHSAFRFATSIGTLIILATAALLISARFSLTGRPAVDLLILAGIANVLFYAFIRTTSNLSLVQQSSIILIAVLFQIATYFSVKMDGLYGNGYPKWAWSWSTASADRDFVSIDKRSVKFPAIRAVSWPGFRGKNCSGIFDDINLQDWKLTSPRLVWSREIGGGWSSFAISDPVCITHEQRGEFEAVVCYELRTGEPVWVHREQARFKEISGGEGPRATPAIFGNKVYSFGATGRLTCLELATGTVVWSRNVLEENQTPNLIFGMSASPLVDDDRVVVAPGGVETAVIAFDRNNGSRIWASGSESGSYSSPQIESICGVKSVLSFNGDGLSGFRFSDGKPMFHVPWLANPAEKNNVCQPVVVETTVERTRVFISSGYGKGSAVFEIRKSGQAFEVSTVWANNRLKSKFASAVMTNGYLFGLDEGILTCLDPVTGKRMWKKGRYGHGQLIGIGNALIVLAEKGYIAWVDASPSNFVERSRRKALQERTWCHPAFSGKYLLVRSDRTAMCFELTVNK